MENKQSERCVGRKWGQQSTLIHVKGHLVDTVIWHTHIHIVTDRRTVAYRKGEVKHRRGRKATCCWSCTFSYLRLEIFFFLIALFAFSVCSFSATILLFSFVHPFTSIPLPIKKNHLIWICLWQLEWKFLEKLTDMFCVVCEGYQTMQPYSKPYV